MNKRIGIIAALVCAFVLCFALVGCGGGADKTKFVGSWTLESGSDENLNGPSSSVRGHSSRGATRTSMPMQLRR